MTRAEATAPSGKQTTAISELVRCANLRETANVRVDRLVVAILIQRAICKDCIVRRRTIEDVVDAAEERPVLEARVRHHQVELAVRSRVGRPGGNQVLRVRTREL